MSREFAVSELESVSSQFAFDLRIPDLPTDYYWFGGTNLFFDCPNVGLWNQWAGYRALQILFEGQFNQLLFDLPSSVQAAQNDPGAVCQIALEFSTNPSFGGMVIDNGGFVQ